MDEYINTDRTAERGLVSVVESIRLLVKATAQHFDRRSDRSLLCGLFVAPQGLVIAGAIAATVVLGMIWPWVGLQGLTCELRFPNQRGVEGQASSVEVILRNRWPFPVWGLAIEGGFFLTQDNEDETAAALSGIGGWSKTKFCWSFRPECRGVYPTTNAKIVTEFPFGVWKVRRDIDTKGQLIVWPKTVTLEPAVLSDGANRSLLRSSDKKSGNEGERIGVRAYREGDSLRFVHWAQTAKCGRLIVSERQGPAQSTAVVAIATDPANAHATGPHSSFECSIRIAASICEQLTRQNVSVWMLANGEYWEVQPTDLSRRHSMDRLATISPSSLVDAGESPVSEFVMHEERFMITTSDQPKCFGPGWKTIVLEDWHEQPSRLALEGQDGWLVIDRLAEPMQQFAQQWSHAVRNSLCDSTRRVGVAS